VPCPARLSNIVCHTRPLYKARAGGGRFFRSSGVAELGFLDVDGVERLFDEHRRGAADHGRILYAIAMFSCWWDQQRASSAPASKRRPAAAIS